MNKLIRCIIVDDEPVAREILENHLARLDSIEVIASCKNAIDAFKVISESVVDLVFLDINMPEVSGLSFARSINKNIKIIFTTAYREYAVDGFDLQAVDYLLKPISFERLQQAIEKYRGESTEHKARAYKEVIDDQPDHLFVRSDRKMIRINFNEVSFIESIGDYLKIHIKENTVITRETISTLEGKLPTEDFIRIHRSFIVALKSITSYTSEYVEINDRQLPISRSYKDQVLKKIEG